MTHNTRPPADPARFKASNATMLTKIEFEIALSDWFEQAEAKHAVSIDVNAGDLHRNVGGYPLPRTGMTYCCDAMRQAMREGDDFLDGPAKGKSVALTIRYRLPR